MRNNDRFPLSDSSFLILLSVSRESLHGYAILKRVEAGSGGRIRLSTGTLFGALKRFLDAGWIERADDLPAGIEGADGGGRIRKAYRLTPPGRRALAQETERLEGLVAAAHAARSSVRLEGRRA